MGGISLVCILALLTGYLIDCLLGVALSSDEFGEFGLEYGLWLESQL